MTAQKHLTPASQALIEAMSESLGVPKNDDYNAASQDGVAAVQMSAHRGRRFSSSRAYLSNGHAERLRVMVGAVVSRVVVEGGRAVGVEILEKSGPRVLRAAKEVVLSAKPGQPNLLEAGNDQRRVRTASELDQYAHCPRYISQHGRGCVFER